jgi:hypothetical protein
MSSAIIAMLGFGVAGITCLAVAKKFVPIMPTYILLMLLGMAASGGSGLAAMAVG